jgi:hypothetical protein
MYGSGLQKWPCLNSKVLGERLHLLRLLMNFEPGNGAKIRNYSVKYTENNLGKKSLENISTY